MKKTILTAMITAAVSGSVMADIADIHAANNQVSLKAISTNFDYTETGDGRLGTKTGILDTETGGVPGFMISAAVSKNLIFKGDYLGVDFSKTNGNTNYVGSYQGGNYGDLRTTSSANTTDLAVRYGKSFDVSKEASITPYAEFGYHEWGRGVNSGETYTHKHYGVGVLAQYSPMQKLVLSANAMIGNTLDSSISVNAIDTRVSAFSEGLGNSTITKFGVAADYAFTKSLHGQVGLNRTSFDYGAGVAVNNTGTSGGKMWEPSSSTTLINTEIGLGYAF